MRITNDYLELNRRLHATGTYGRGGLRWAATVLRLIERVGSRDVLDYGCGARTLEKALGFPIRNYDPCIAGLDAEPSPADIVVCTDVLEHIEPECLDQVLDHLRDLAREAAFLVIATRPALKTLPDGRNAHLIQEPMAWWMPRIRARFDLMEVQDVGGEEFIVAARRLGADPRYASNPQ